MLLALLLWQGAAMALDSRLLLASPYSVLLRLGTLLGEPAFLGTVLFSFWRIVLGFLLGLSLGALLAAAAARFAWVETLLFPYMGVIKATPVASFIILCLLFLRAAYLSVFISFLMVLPIIYTNLLQGIRAADRQLLEVGTVFRLPFWRQVAYLYLPQVKPYLLSACSVALGLSWKAGVAAEVIGIPDGSVGERLYEAKLYLDSAGLFAWTVVILCISVVFERLFLAGLRAGFAALERR